METAIFIAFSIFFLKHFVVDFLLQTRWMYSHKHEWGHLGGVVHAGLHGIATTLVLWVFLLCGITGTSSGWLFALYLGMFDYFVHYVVDWSKMNLNIAKGWKVNSVWFWYTLGADQFLHNMTYVMILILWFW